MTTTCERCGQAMRVGEWPFCPHGVGHNSVLSDECDFMVENGFPEPRRFTSKADHRRALAEQGFELGVRHVPLQGSDRSPYTTDWSKCTDPQTLANAAILVARNGTAKGRDPAPPPSMPVTMSIRDWEGA